MAEADLVLTDVDLEDYSTALDFVYAYRRGAPVQWAGRSWRIVDYHCSTKAAGARFTFKLIEFPVPEAVGHFVFPDGYCGRVEVEQDSTMVVRIDNLSMPRRLAGARTHFRSHYETGDAFSGDDLWGNGEPVRATEYRWDPVHHVVRITIERAKATGTSLGCWCCAPTTPLARRWRRDGCASIRPM